MLFVLAADTGVTKTDLDVWTQHLSGGDDGAAAGRLVVLNKIDGLWDELKTDAEVDAEIRRQVTDSARLLGVPPAQVFAVSAQKALLAKVNGDDALLAKSRLPALEDALSGSLHPGEARHRRHRDRGRGARRSRPTCARSLDSAARGRRPCSSRSCASCAARTRTSSTT